MSFTAKDLKTGKMVRVSIIDFTNGEVTYITIIDENNNRETRRDGEDLELYLYGKKILI